MNWCRTSLAANSDAEIVAGLLFTLAVMVGAGWVIVWAVRGAFRRRLVLSRDGRHYREGRAAVLAAAATVPVMIIGIVVWALIMTCTLIERGWLSW